jgi:hypothetical protein
MDAMDIELTVVDEVEMISEEGASRRGAGLQVSIVMEDDVTAAQWSTRQGKSRRGWSRSAMMADGPNAARCPWRAAGWWHALARENEVKKRSKGMVAAGWNGEGRGGGCGDL